MTRIEKLNTATGGKLDYTIDDDKHQTINGSALTILPALIDPHVHFRTPGQEYKEDWQTGARTAIAGGITTVFDMPNNSPDTIDSDSLKSKQVIINKQLKEVNMPLNFYLYFGATPNNHDTYSLLKNEIIGIKLFMGSSTGNLLVNKKEDQAKVFKAATASDLVVAVHAEDESIIQENYTDSNNVKMHSKIRDRQAATKAVKQAVELAEKYGTKLYICHINTKEEIEIIKQAKNRGIEVYAEVTPHHLFLTEDDYDQLGTKAQMNPPVRTLEDQRALWQAIGDGVIDTIGTDHAPHSLKEKAKPYPQSPSGVPGIETLLPLLLNAHSQNKISLEKIIKLTRTNIQKIFNLPNNNDKVIVDLNLVKKVENKNLKTKCGWSPFHGWELTGWPVYTVLNNKLYKC
ncbi:MAG: dihydroorotase [bacterium]